MMKYLDNYFLKTPQDKRTSAATAYLAALDCLQEENPEVAEAIIQELKDQRSYLKLIASENFSSLPTQLAMGNLLTDKYSEGIVKRRFYSGCDNVDSVEALAAELLKQIFGCEHAYVQPHSGADANLVAFWAILMGKVQSKELEALGKKNVAELTETEHEKIRQLLVNQKLMGLSLHSGGHLTHGYRMNISSKLFRAVTYDVDPVTEMLDYAALAKQVQQEKPTILLAGYSAYPRLLNFAKLKEIADSVGAVLMGDIAHFSGLVAGKALQGEYDPVPYCDVISSTTHKTFRGPRGGIVLCKKEYQDYVDKGCPFVLGGPLPHVMAAKAVAFREASQQPFRVYAKQIIKNAAALAEELKRLGVTLFTGGTENHLVVANMQASFGLNGRQAESVLREAGITVNRNMVPFDQNGPWYTSGIRLGSPAMTTLGMREEEMKQIARMIVQVLKAAKKEATSKGLATVDAKVLHEVKASVQELLAQFPLYPEIVIE